MQANHQGEEPYQRSSSPIDFQPSSELGRSLSYIKNDPCLHPPDSDNETKTLRGRWDYHAGNRAATSNRSLPSRGSSSFESLPDQVLLLIFHHLTPFQRSQLLSISTTWNQVILQHREFWQDFTAPVRLPISTAISVLQIFNQRSHFTLRDVAFEVKIKEVDDLLQIFDELEQSSSTLRTLILVQEYNLNKSTMRMSRQDLPNLNSLACIQTSTPAKAVKSIREMIKELDMEGEQEGLRYLSTSTIFGFTEEDKEWFRSLEYLEVYATDQVETLHSALAASKASLKTLQIVAWEPCEDELGDSHSHLEILEMDALKLFFLPQVLEATKVIESLINIRDDEVRVDGSLECLLCFEKCSFEFVEISFDEEAQDAEQMDNEDSGPIFEEKIKLFFGMNPFISVLKLYNPGSDKLDFILRKLIESGRGGIRFRYLSHLQILSISNPVSVSGSLLENCLISRQENNPRFDVRVWVGDLMVKNED